MQAAPCLPSPNSLADQLSPVSSVSSSEWEEPHPGRRLYAPVETGLGVTQEPELTAENNDIQKEVADGGSEGAVVNPDGSTEGSMSESGVASEASLSDETIQVDIEMTNVETKSEKPSTNAPMLRPMSELIPSWTDFSNFLERPSNASVSSISSDDGFTTRDVDGCCPLPNECDLYGWNAEWEKQHIPGHTLDAFLPRNQGARKAAKVSLLKRVLSVGKVATAGRRAGFGT